jgi:hypothetical protein
LRSVLIANWPGAISAAVIERGCGEIFVDIACPKFCKFGNVCDSWSSESILSRPTIRGGGDTMGGRQRTMVERLADEDALDQGYEFS